MAGTDKSLTNLMNTLNSTDWKARDQAIEELAEYRERAFPMLIMALGDERWLVREGAVVALGMIGNEDAVIHLLPLLKDSEYGVRERAATALGEIGDPRAVEALVRTLSDVQPDVREMAAWALGKIGDSRAGGALLDVLADSFDKAEIEVEDNAAWALEQLGEGVIESLIEALHNHKNYRVRAEAASLIGKVGTEQGVQELKLALQNESDEFVLKVIESVLQKRKDV